MIKIPIDATGKNIAKLKRKGHMGPIPIPYKNDGVLVFQDEDHVIRWMKETGNTLADYNFVHRENGQIALIPFKYPTWNFTTTINQIV